MSPTLPQKASWGFSRSHHRASSSTLSLSPTQQRGLTICLHQKSTLTWHFLNFTHCLVPCRPSLTPKAFWKSVAPWFCQATPSALASSSSPLSQASKSQLSPWLPPTQNSTGMN